MLFRSASEVYALNASLKLMNIVPIVAPRDGTSPVAGNLMRSDHTPFWLKGQEALFFTDTANFRTPYYHTAKDTQEKLDAASFRQAVQLSAAALAYWAGGAQ